MNLFDLFKKNFDELFGKRIFIIKIEYWFKVL